MADSDQNVRLDLEGEHTAKGIELSSLERFLGSFRAALRDFERSVSARSHQVGRGGHPETATVVASNFKLVGFRIGSAILDLAEVAGDEHAADTLNINAEGAATRNLRSMLDCVDRGTLAGIVVDRLDDARRALGEGGRFGVTVPKRARGLITAQTIEHLRACQGPAPRPEPTTVFGRLHLIASETHRVEIRTADNFNWACAYDASLNGKVIPLIARRVWARGRGVRERSNRGTLDIKEIGALPEYETTPLFHVEAVTISELSEQQQVQGPQGLDVVGVDDLSDEEVDRFLATMLE